MGRPPSLEDEAFGFDSVMAVVCERLGKLFDDPRISSDAEACAILRNLLLARDPQDLGSAVDLLQARVARILDPAALSPAEDRRGPAARTRLRL